MVESYRSFTVILYDHNPLHLQKVWGSADCVMMKVSREYCSSHNLSNIDEFTKPCLYILVDEQEKAYIGQARAFASRVKDHLAKKNWWTRAYVFVSDSGRYHTASVEYLEYRAILEAQEIARYDCSENKQTPGTPTLPSHEHSQMNEALREIKYFLKYERCLIFEKPKPVTDSSGLVKELEKTQDTIANALTLEIATTTEEDLHLFYVHNKGHVAQGYYPNDGTKSLVVLKGSEIVAQPCASFKTHKLRELLIQHCEKSEDDKWILRQDYQFESPSTAASCCLGRSSNGWEAWKDADGRTLKQYIEEIKN